MTNLVENDDFKKYLRYSNIQITVIKALKMTIELPLYAFTKALPRLKSPGLADNAS